MGRGVKLTWSNMAGLALTEAILWILGKSIRKVISEVGAEYNNLMHIISFLVFLYHFNITGHFLRY